MKPIVAELNEIEGLQVDLIALQNDFFGSNITVSGLLSGKDIPKYLAESF